MGAFRRLIDGLKGVTQKVAESPVIDRLDSAVETGVSRAAEVANTVTEKAKEAVSSAVEQVKETAEDVTVTVVGDKKPTKPRKPRAAKKAK